MERDDIISINAKRNLTINKTPFCISIYYKKIIITKIRECKKSPDRKKAGIRKNTEYKLSCKSFKITINVEKHLFYQMFFFKYMPFCYCQISPLDVPSHAFGLPLKASQSLALSSI